ncbi:MAG: hypothetical protein IT395_01510 [Candidatus Omnitrophica bacterium]|nr:hypothetical protein [Candidatus Omnitrophota bacterium]
MSFSDFMNKVRQWDMKAARWMMRHFYILFFEFVLLVIFCFFLYGTYRTIDVAHSASATSVTEQLLVQQATGTSMIIILMLLNSFWMLYMFSEVTRLRTILKDISFYQSRRKSNFEK